MNDWNKLSRQAEYYKKLYPVGTRIYLECMGDDPRPVPPGSRGTVRAVDDIGNVHCSFDNGRSMGLVPGEDSFRKLTAKELKEEALEDKAAFLEDFFWKQKITMGVWVEDGHLIAEDDEDNRWVDAEIYDLAVNECLCFYPDGTLSDGLCHAEPFAERLVKDAKEFGVEITSYVRSVDHLISEAVQEKGNENKPVRSCGPDLSL